MPENIGIVAIATALGVESDELTQSLKSENGEWKENATQELVESLSNRIKLLREEEKKKGEEKLTNFVNKTKKETSTAYESALKELLPEGSDLKGAEAYRDALKELLNKRKSEKPEGYNFRADEEYIAELNNLKKQFEEQKSSEVSEWQKKYNALEMAIENEKVDQILDKKLRAFWATRKPDFQDETIKENQFQLHKDRVRHQGNIKVIDGELILVNQEGEPLKNELGHLVPIDKIYTDTFVGFVPEVVQGGRSSSGLGKDGMTYKGALPTNDAELEAITNNPSIPWEERLAIIENYEKSKK